jgi:hypothetical protein
MKELERMADFPAPELWVPDGGSRLSVARYALKLRQSCLERFMAVLIEGLCVVVNVNVNAIATKHAGSAKAFTAEVPMRRCARMGNWPALAS